MIKFLFVYCLLSIFSTASACSDFSGQYLAAGAFDNLEIAQTRCESITFMERSIKLNGDETCFVHEGLKRCSTGSFLANGFLNIQFHTKYPDGKTEIDTDYLMKLSIDPDFGLTYITMREFEYYGGRAYTYILVRKTR